MHVKLAVEPSESHKDLATEMTSNNKTVLGTTQSLNTLILLQRYNYIHDDIQIRGRELQLGQNCNELMAAFRK